MMQALAALEGWAADDHAAALAAYAVTADLLPAGWPQPDGEALRDPKRFFEARFRTEVIGTPPALFTGYYEPEVAGRSARAPGFEHALFAMPNGIPVGKPWLSRAEIEHNGILAGSELVWLASPVEAFLAQVQGSVRVVLGNGATLRLGHCGKNGHPYRSIGAELIARGQIAALDMSAQAIRAWCVDHPGEVAALLQHNPTFVFFTALDLPDSSGPIGAMGKPVNAGRSLAVDPAHHQLGAPIWVETSGETRALRLMIAQDTGSAIKGAQRGDIFCGSGTAAGDQAGKMRLSGRLVTFLPRAMAQT